MGDTLATCQIGTRFGRILRHCREQMGLTQLELADLSTVSVRAIRNLEVGLARNPRRETVRLLADGLRLDGEQRAALQLAAGQRADDATFRPSSAFVAPQISPLYGRAGDLATLRSLLLSASRKPVWVTGFGGVGKTTLARAVAASISERQGIPTLWVSLEPAASAPVQSPQGFRTPLWPWIEGLVTNDNRAIKETSRLIGDQAALLVLDGNDVGQISYQTVMALAACCSQVRIMITSRVAGVAGAGHHHYPLAPLSVLDRPAGGRPRPDATGSSRDTAPEDPAVDLLLSAVRGIDPHFPQTADNTDRLAELCGLLDGIPRALAAAASWFLLSSPTSLVEIARDDPVILATPPQDANEPGWVREAVVSATRELEPCQSELLDWACGWDEPWTLAQAGARGGVDLLTSAQAVHALLTRGLIRPAVTPARFTVLNLVRASLELR